MRSNLANYMLFLYALCWMQRNFPLFNNVDSSWKLTMRFVCGILTPWNRSGMCKWLSIPRFVFIQVCGTLCYDNHVKLNLPLNNTFAWSLHEKEIRGEEGAFSFLYASKYETLFSSDVSDPLYCGRGPNHKWQCSRCWSAW